MTLTVFIKPHVLQAGDIVTGSTETLTLTANQPSVSVTESIQEIVEAVEVSDWSNLPPFFLQKIQEHVTISPPYTKLVLSAKVPSVSVTRNIRCYVDPAIFGLIPKEPALTLQFSQARADEEVELTELLGLIL